MSVLVILLHVDRYVLTLLAATSVAVEMGMYRMEVLVMVSEQKNVMFC